MANRSCALSLLVSALLMVFVLPPVCQATEPARPQAATATVATVAAPLSASLPVDPQVTTGRFANGLHYFVRVNKEPANRAELRLAVNAGSILEDDDQLGLAHFVEHMAFNGTLHFPKQELVRFLESTGMRFGPSINAFTSFDETVYMLQIPTDTGDLLGRAFLILEDWAHNVSFDAAEIDKERGVIIEEWRTRLGAGSRIQEQQLPVMFKGARYADRLPIGKTEILRSFPHDRLRQFYRDWYRPDLMTVVAVGDFDPVAVLKLIEQHFGSIPPAKTPRLRPTYGIPDTPGTMYSIATDPETTMTSVGVINKLPRRDRGTIGAYRQGLVQRLYLSMFNARCAELAQKPDPPFLAGAASYGSMMRSRDAATLNAVVKDTGITRGLEAVTLEAHRVAKLGFTPTEFDRQKRDILRRVERQAAEKDKQPSSGLADRLARYALQGEPVLAAEYEQGLVQRFLPEITLAEVNALAPSWLGESNRVVTVVAPRKDGLAIPDAGALAGVVASAASQEVEPYVDTADTKPLLDPLPTPGRVVSSTTNEKIRLTEWRLSNGIRVALMPTDFKQDEIVFRGFSPGGTSLASDADYVAAATSAQVVSAGGVGAFTQIELRKFMAGKVATARVGFTDLNQYVTGSASAKDLETMFQMIHLGLTKPRADPAMFAVLTSQARSMLANQKAQPEYAFSEALSQIMTQGHPRGRMMTADMVGEWDLDKSMAFYKARFADTGGFTFVFVGSFDLDTMRPLIERYLGSLPAGGRPEAWKDTGVRPPRGVVEKTVERGIEQKSRVALVFTGPFEFDQTARVAVRSLASILQTRLRETLREDLSGTYGASVSATYSKSPESQYAVQVGFTCNPARVDELIKATFREIDALRTSGPTERQVADVRAAMLRDLETNLRSNSYVMGQIYARYVDGEDPAGFFTIAPYYETLDAATILRAARTYLDTNNYVKVILMPEKPK
ncbi:MAG: insulinase family protein [Acidobacteriota bacterium]